MNWNEKEAISQKVDSRSSAHTLLAHQNSPVVVFVVLLLICVAADGDDADGRAGRVGDDDGLPGGMVLVLVLRVTGGAAGLLGFAGPPTDAAAALQGLAVGSRAILERCATWGRVLLHPLGALW